MHSVCSALLHVQYLYVKCTIAYVTFHFYFKVPLKKIKKVIPEEDLFDVNHKYRNIMNNHSCSKTTYN